MTSLKPPFPYFGGKMQVASIVWKALGKVARYIEPFFGSGAVLLNRPDFGESENWQYEIVNDKDCYLANVWRSIKYKTEETATYADWPVNHCDLSARRRWLFQNPPSIENLQNDPEWCDPKAAGYWIWGMSVWIGSGFLTEGIDAKKRPHLTSHKGVHAVEGPRPNIVDSRGISSTEARPVLEWFRRLLNRLERVKVVCGDWERVCGGNWQLKGTATCGMFFDPPYAVERSDCYRVEDYSVSHKVREYCLEKGKEKGMRLVLAGYLEEHESLLQHGWKVHCWTTMGGYANMGDLESRGRENRSKEALFFSPECEPIETLKQESLFGEEIENG